MNHLRFQLVRPPWLPPRLYIHPSLTAESGATISADVVYKCVGVMPNTAMLKGTPFEGTFAECDAYEKKTALYETKDGFRGSYDDCVAHENDPSLANPLVPTTATL